MKICTRCGVSKELDQFGIDRTRPDGRTHACRECRRASSARYREAHPEKLAAQNRKPRHRRAGAGQKAWALRNPDRIRVMGRAGEALRRAVRAGVLTRPANCQQCGQIGPIEGAHHDYGQPLDVRWLCRRCHRNWDRAQPKTVDLPVRVLARMKPGPKPNNPEADDPATDKAYEDEPLKAAVSDGFKRAAVQWAIGRWLYGD